MVEKIPKKEKKESWSDFLARLEKNMVAKPNKRDFDIKRQKISAKESQCRRQVQMLVNQANKQKEVHTKLQEEYNLIKGDDVFERFRTQLGNTQAANDKLQQHKASVNALKDQKRSLGKMLGKYRNLEEVDREIEQTKAAIEGGYHQSLKEERAAIQKMKKLNRLRAAASEQKDLDAQIDALQGNEAYQSDLNLKNEQNDKLQDIKAEKREREQDKDQARDKMNQAWEKMKEMWTKKADLIEKAKEHQKNAAQVSQDYRAAENHYMAFQRVYQKAQEEAKKEKLLRRRKERENQEREEQSTAMDLMGTMAPRVGDDPGRAANNNRPQKSPTEKKQPQQSQNQNSAPKKPRPPKKKKDGDKEEEKEKNNMIDMVVPFMEEIEQFEALEGYLKTLMPREAPKQPEQATGRRKKKRKVKKTGQLKHNLNWVTAFGNAGVGTLLPNRRENVEASLKEITAKLEEWRGKSTAAKQKSAEKSASASPKKEEAAADDSAAPAQQEQDAEPVKKEVTKDAGSSAVPDAAVEQHEA